MEIPRQIELNVIQAEMEHLCAFSLGVRLIHNQKVTYEKLRIERDNQRIREALACTVSFGTLPLGGAHDLETLLQKAGRDQTLTPSELLMILDHQHCLESIQSYRKTCTVESPALDELWDSLSSVAPLAKAISACLDSYGEVKDSASSKLQTIRRSQKETEGSLASLTNAYIREHGSSLLDTIVAYRQGRAVVLVKASEKNTLKGIVHGESGSGLAVYFEPLSFVDLNNKKQTLVDEEEEEIHRILFELSQQVKQEQAQLQGNTDTLGLLDALFAKAEWGKQHQGVVASLTTNRSLRLTKAFHPLINPKEVVANNYVLEEPHRLLLITGPNTGGKTVSLKVIVLSVLMTYLGMPICAEEAEVPFYDEVFVDIGDTQSVSESLSTFSAHLAKLAEVTKKATQQSLLVLDELGSGTDPKEGEALAIALLNDFIKRQCMGVITTHYGGLKAYGKSHPEVLLASVEFDTEHLKPTYHFVEGLVGQSNALAIAERFGLNASIIEEARKIKESTTTEQEALIEELERQKSEQRHAQQELEEQLAKNETLYRELEQQQKQWDEKKAQAMDTAKQEASSYLEQVKQEADRILQTVLENQQTSKYHEILQEAKKLDELEETEETVDENHVYAVEDLVELRSSNQVGTIESLSKDRLVLNINGVKIKSSLDKIRPSALKKLPESKKRVEGSSNFSVPVVHTECLLVGMHVEEALDEMDRFLDQARLAHLTTVRIIHGDGTGALRKAVHDRLNHLSFVQEYRLGMPQEGSTGATVVTLK